MADTQGTQQDQKVSKRKHVPQSRTAHALLTARHQARGSHDQPEGPRAGVCSYGSAILLTCSPDISSSSSLIESRGRTAPRLTSRSSARSSSPSSWTRTAPARCVDMCRVHTCLCSRVRDEGRFYVTTSQVSNLGRLYIHLLECDTAALVHTNLR